MTTIDQAGSATAPEVVTALRHELLRLAAREDAAALAAAASVPYWAPCPSSVVGHQAAAVALRDAARLAIAS